MKPRLILGVAAIAVALGAAAIASFPFTGSEKASPPTVQAQLPAPVQSPVVPIANGDMSALQNNSTPPIGLRIPSISVDAQVIPSGLNASGEEMEVPEIDIVGWYRFGSKPGEAGSTLLAGHVDGEGNRGIFWSLRSLKPDASIELDTLDTTHNYRVVSIERFPKEDLPSSVFRRGGQSTLTLVTCGGRFDKTTGHYEDNVVVMAVPA